MIAFARDVVEVKRPMVRRASPPPRLPVAHLWRWLLDGWLVAAALGYLAALAGVGK